MILEEETEVVDRLLTLFTPEELARLYNCASDTRNEYNDKLKNIYFIINSKLSVEDKIKSIQEQVKEWKIYGN